MQSKFIYEKTHINMQIQFPPEYKKWIHRWEKEITQHHLLMECVYYQQMIRYRIHRDNHGEWTIVEEIGKKVIPTVYLYTPTQIETLPIN